MSELKSKKFLLSFVAFILLNATLYLFILIFNNKVSFNKFNYYYNAHHYIQDTRIAEKRFNILNALAQYDAQWYLKISNEGYPKNPKIATLNDRRMDGVTYNFLPLYPALIYVANLFFRNIELSAFIVSNVFLLVAFTSLYYAVTKIFSENIAIKTVFLLFLFPFAIFYRSYYTVGVFLFLLVWFLYFLLKRKFFLSALFLSLLSLSWGMSIFLNMYFLYILFLEVKNKKLSFSKAAILGILLSIPWIGWVYFNYLQTGNPLYFYLMRQQWFNAAFPETLFHNIQAVLNFGSQAFHSFHSSKIDIAMIIAVAFLLFKSRNKLPKELWFVSVILGITPLLIQDTISYSRLQIVSFPFFIYLSQVLNGLSYKILLALFIVGLFIISLFFINWYWVG